MTELEPIVFKDGGLYLMKPDDCILRFACCDCGLVHDITFKVMGDNLLAFRLDRNDEMTKEIRREPRADDKANRR